MQTLPGLAAIMLVGATLMPTGLPDITPANDDMAIQQLRASVPAIQDLDDLQRPPPSAVAVIATMAPCPPPGHTDGAFVCVIEIRPRTAAGAWLQISESAIPAAGTALFEADRPLLDVNR